MKEKHWSAYAHSKTKHNIFRVTQFSEKHIISTVLYELFVLDDALRKLGCKDLILYNRTVHIEIWKGEELYLDTRLPKYKEFYNLLKFNRSKRSKLRLYKVVQYLVDLNSSNIEIEGFEEEYLKELLELIRINNELKKKDEIPSYNDYQLAIICRGLDKAGARGLAEQYLINQSWTSDEKEEAIKYVSKAHGKYGVDLLNYCLTLDSNSIYIKDTKRVFTYFDKIKKSKEPCLRLNLDKQTEVEFYYQEKADSLVVKKNNFEQIGEIRRDGTCMVHKSKNYNASLLLFLRFAQDPLKEIMFFGLHTGKCSFCGQRLTDPISIKHGYGKKCAKNFDLDWEN
jgi:hypothetical protein